ncbi:MAG: hypothetical protein DGJ47_000257 [Rickettsiaceae bacterium]
MLQQITIAILLGALITSCTPDPSGYLKRSANNKLFDRTGFHGEKRAPLYNPKYIHNAKKNIARGDYRDEMADDYENEGIDENTHHKNIQMYKQMLDQEEYERRARSKRKWYQFGAKKRDIYYEQEQQNNHQYPDLSRAKKRKSSGAYAGAELKQELDQIKSMLKETRKELENSKCPTSRAIEKNKNAPQMKRNSLPDNSDYIRSL